MILSQIFESRQFDHTKLLSSISDELATRLIDADVFNPDENPTISQYGTLKDWVDSKTLSGLYTRLRDIKVLIDTRSSGIPVGIFDPDTKSITFDVPRTFSKSELSNLISHELRHALDHSLSKSKALKGRLNWKSDDAIADYLQLPYEVNARFTQVLDELRRMPYTGDVSTLIDILDKHKLTDAVFKSEQYKRFKINGNVIRVPADNKKFRKLFGRAMQYWKLSNSSQ